MRKIRLFFFITGLLVCIPRQAFQQINLRYNNNETLTYDEVIAAYRYLDQKYDRCRLFNIGPTDIGRPLQLFVMSSDGDFDPVTIHKAGKVVVFINNGIHPGEPPGVDASIEFSENVLSGKNGLDKILDHTVICIVPVYNIGGALNRGSYSRANQTTPPESGFRGNAQNLDLNRDFIKMDSKNAQSLVKAFHKWKPEVFLDTHVTDGSDHQYVITLIPTIFQRLPSPMNRYFKEEMVPSLFNEMRKGTYELIPYVNWVDRMKPEKGLIAYYDAPRISTGFASLFNTFAFMTENHVYKDFRDQVKSVYQFLSVLTGFSNAHAQKIIETRKLADRNTIQMHIFTRNWKLDTTRFDKIRFKGYEGVWKNSPLTGIRSYYYDRQKPFTREIPLYRYFLTAGQVEKPAFYIIPQAWDRAIQHLKWNGVKMERLLKDTLIEVQVYYITNARFAKQPNNGHFRIEQIQTRPTGQQIQFRKGDYVIPMNQPANRFVMEVLEPGAFDSYLSWDFFNPIFDRREYFSPYGFEPNAIYYLKKHPDLAKELEQRREADPSFARSTYAQLNFIYANSPYMEKSYRRYPVYRINESKGLQVK